MPSSTNQSAEQRFREAFARLKNGNPKVLPIGALVSQNNIAKEAGCDPSALRKSRYPELISEIQTYVHVYGEERPPSTRQKVLRNRQKNRSIREAKRDSDRQRDSLASQLLCANAMIVELNRKLTDAEAKLDALVPKARPISFPSGKTTDNPKQG